jgi:DNA-binding NarL/FixJ family response regulator
MKRLRIVLADDQSQVVCFLNMFPDPNYDVVGAVRDQQDLVTAAMVLKPDIILVNIDMPKLNGIQAIRQIRKVAPNCRVILKSSQGDPETMAAAYSAGASGYLVNGAPPSAIRMVIDHPGVGEQQDPVLCNEDCCPNNY